MWFGRNDRLGFHALRGSTYVSIPRGEVLPPLDPVVIMQCMTEPSQTEAVAALRRRLRGE